MGERNFTDVKVSRLVVTLYRMTQEKDGPVLVSMPVRGLLVKKKARSVILQLKSIVVVIKECWSSF